MFDSNTIPLLCELLERRGVSLFHACQLRDFESYVAIGGVPSRRALETEGLAFTPFASDTGDIRNASWDKVFLNIQDFGEGFQGGGRQRGWVPNVYGPLTLVFSPAVLHKCQDVAISLKSAGREGFQRHADSIATVEDVDRLFIYPPDHSLASRVKSRRQLGDEFGIEAPSNPEVSCTIDTEFLSLDDAEHVLIDPYVFRGISLRDWVSSLRDLPATVELRSRCEDPLYEQIGELLATRPHTPRTLMASADAPDPVKRWSEAVDASEWPWQFHRYASYLRDGTIMWVSEHPSEMEEPRSTSPRKTLQTIRKTFPRAYDPWSSSEEEQLLSMARNGVTIEEMARTLGRQPGAIRSRLFRNGVSV